MRSPASPSISSTRSLACLRYARPISRRSASSIALYPGGAASAWVFRDGLGSVCGIPLMPTLVVTLLGGLTGRGAAGLMMIASWSLFKDADIKALNAPRTLMVTAANTVAIICFSIAGKVRWEAALLVGAGAIVGGYAGAHLGRRLDPKLVRYGTLLLSTAITLYFFIRRTKYE